jgi:nitrogen PTS system EIIA component
MPHRSLPIPTRIIPRLLPNSRRAILQTLTRQIADDMHIHLAGVTDMFEPHNGARFTAVGDGVVIIDALVDYLEESYVLVARLAHKVNFQADDGKMIDLVFLVLSPTAARVAHMQMIGRLTRAAHHNAFTSGLRSATSMDAMRALFIAPDDRAIAA